MKFDIEELKRSLKHRVFCPGPEPVTMWASVNIIFSIIEGQPSLVMIKRATNPHDPWSGHYAFPGGKLECGENYWQAAARETFEEVGLSLGDENRLGEFLRFQVRYQDKCTPYGISAHLSYIENWSGSFIIDKEEVAQAFWLPLEKFLRDDYVDVKPLGEHHFMKYPCISFDGHLIWGISYFILWELFFQLRDLEKPLSFRVDHLPLFSYHYESD